MRASGAAAALLLASTGCTRHFDSVDEACKDKVAGDQFGSDESVAFFERLACYRRFAHVDKPKINEQVTAATEAHTDWLDQNLAQATFWNVEVSGTPGFTGETVFDRLDAAEFPIDVAATEVWEVLMPADPSRPRAEMVDEIIHDPFYRDPLFAPGWLGGGYAEGHDQIAGLAYAVWTLYLPSGRHTSKPVLWPIDGQTGVPLSYTSYFAYDASTIGYPITMTFGSSEVSGSSDNPLGVNLHSSTITAEDGTTIDHEVVLPQVFDDGSVDYSTVILWPTVAFEPNTTYTVEVDVGWVTIDHKKIDWSFTTGTEGIDHTLFERGAARPRLTPVGLRR